MNSCPDCFDDLEVTHAAKGTLVTVLCPTCNTAYEFAPAPALQVVDHGCDPAAAAMRLHALRRELGT